MSYTHSRRLCPEKQNCLLVKTGNCPNFHPPCRYGVDCHRLQQRKCSYSHPRIHFAIISHEDNEDDDINDDNANNSTHKVDHKDNSQKDDDSIINAIHPIKPSRHSKPWQKWEDEKLVKYINSSKNIKDHKYLSQFMNEFQRKESSILARIQKIKATKKNKESQKTHDHEKDKNDDEDTEEEDDDDDDDDDSEDTSSSEDEQSNKSKSVDSGLCPHKQQLMDALNDLNRYYGKMKNRFEIRNIEYLIKRVNESTYNGELKQLEDIVGCDVGYFKDKVNTMKQKYGPIDQETQDKTMKLLGNVKALCQKQVENIDRIVSNVKKEHWLGDKGEFVKITKHELSYFAR
eukprot:77533_1